MTAIYSDQLMEAANDNLNYYSESQFIKPVIYKVKRIDLDLPIVCKKCESKTTFYDKKGAALWYRNADPSIMGYICRNCYIVEKMRFIENDVS